MRLTVERILPGLHIRLPLKWKDHPFLLTSFKIKDQQQVEMIRHLGVKYVYVNEEQSDVKPLPEKAEQANTTQAISLDREAKKLWQEKHKRIEKLRAYRRSVLQREEEFERTLARMRSAMSKMRNRPANVMSETNQMVEDIVDKLMCEENITLHLINGQADFDSIYFHSLNVAILSMMIGKAKGYSIAELKELGIAALLHDIGKIKIPTAILRKTDPLTEPENNYFKRHIKYSLDMARRVDGFSEKIKTAIAQHHELRDGSGYPEGLKNDEIDEFAQVIAVANAFDNLCHSPILAEQKIPYMALSHLYKNCKHLYKEENLNILIKLMGVFPPGTVVQLSNDMIGVVISVNASNLLLPNVLIYDPSVPSSQAPVIDLVSRDLTVVSAIHPAKLPDEIKEYLNPRARISYFFDSSE